MPHIPESSAAMKVFLVKATRLFQSQIPQYLFWATRAATGAVSAATGDATGAATEAASLIYWSPW